jgi:hypothetical protein
MQSSSAELRKRHNAVLAERNLRRVESCAQGLETNDVKCRQLVGMNCDAYKEYFKTHFEDKGFSWPTYKHHWHFAFHTNPRKLDLQNPIAKGMAFCAENMYPRRNEQVS